MFPGTRFYYDRNGRYRGKASNQGPVTMAIWSMAGFVFLGYLFWEAISAIWVGLLLIASTIGLACSLIGFLTGSEGNRKALFWAVPLCIMSVVGASIGLVALGGTTDHPIVQGDQKSADSDDGSHPTHIESDPSIADTPPTLTERRDQPDVNSRPGHVAESPEQKVTTPNVPMAPPANADQSPIKKRLPSFSCQMATQPVEELICSDRQLSSLDGDLGDLYRRALDLAESPGVIRQAQRNWMYYRRNQCRNRDCVMAAYAERRVELSGVVGR
jgi:uncharacterized protein YecT (DUF1311 family)